MTKKELKIQKALGLTYYCVDCNKDFISPHTKYPPLLCSKCVVKQ